MIEENIEVKIEELDNIEVNVEENNNINTKIEGGEIIVDNEKLIRRIEDVERKNEDQDTSIEELNNTVSELHNYDDTEVREEINNIKEDITDLENNKANKEEVEGISTELSNKANKTDLNSTLQQAKEYTDNLTINDIKNITYDEDTATFVFTRHDNTTLTVDLPIEQTVQNGYYDEETEELVLVLVSGQEIRIPATGLIDDYAGIDTATIQCTISADNKITCNIKGGSITKTLLTTELQEEINNKLEQSDLTDYVKNTDYATSSKGGVVKLANCMASSNGAVYFNTKTLQDYKNMGNTNAISKGTLENIKDDYVGNSTPVQEIQQTIGDIATLLDDINGTEV